MKDKTFYVSTPGGDIVAKSMMGGKEYPSVDICLNDNVVCFVEWHPDEKQFNLLIFNTPTVENGFSEEPIFVLKDITKIHGNPVAQYKAYLLHQQS